jgi:hypothetical protein
MITRWKKSEKGIPSKTCSRSEALLEENRTLIASIDALMLGEKNLVFQDYFLPLVRRYTAFILDLPASEFHHHAKTGGLFTHSLEVVLASLKRFERHLVQEMNVDGSLNAMATLQRKHRWQYGLAVAALLHDLGKVVDMQVEANQQAWDAFREGLESFLDRIHAVSYTVQWREGRKAGEHESWTLLFAARLMTSQDISFAGVEIWTQVLDALTRQPTAGNRIGALLQSADQVSSKEGVEVTHPKAPPAEPSNRDKALAIVEAIRILFERGDLAINRRRSPVYVFEGKTACVVPAILESVRSYLRQEKISLPKDNIRIYDLLQDRGLLETRNNQAVIGITLNPDGRKPYGLKVILIKNEFLWNGKPPALYTGEIQGLEVPSPEKHPIGQTAEETG